MSYIPSNWSLVYCAYSPWSHLERSLTVGGRRPQNLLCGKWSHHIPWPKVWFSRSSYSTRGNFAQGVCLGLACGNALMPARLPPISNAWLYSPLSSLASVLTILIQFNSKLLYTLVQCIVPPIFMFCPPQSVFRVRISYVTFIKYQQFLLHLSNLNL